LPFGCSRRRESLKVGEWVIAIRLAVGLESSVTAGNRQREGTLNRRPVRDSTDVAITPGTRRPLIPWRRSRRHHSANLQSAGRSGGYMGSRRESRSNMRRRVPTGLRAKARVIRESLGVAIGPLTRGQPIDLLGKPIARMVSMSEAAARLQGRRRAPAHMHHHKVRRLLARSRRRSFRAISAHVA